MDIAIGDTVRYVGSMDGKESTLATVNGTYADQSVDLTLQEVKTTDTIRYHRHVPYSEIPKMHTWHHV